jgi:hypothetical protein
MIAGSDRAFHHLVHRFDSPDDAVSPNDPHRVGRYGKAAGFRFPGGFAVNALSASSGDQEKRPLKCGP